MVDAASGFYKVNRYNMGYFFVPVDLEIHLSHKHNSLNVGVGLLAGSIFPGSNRLIVNGIALLAWFLHIIGERSRIGFR